MTTWDSYYYDMCNTVASNSKCMSRKIGAVLVRDKTIIGAGYNGPPRNHYHCDIRHFYDKKLEAALPLNYLKSRLQECPRRLLGYKSGEGLNYCTAGHAERNAIANSARMGIATKDCILFMSCGIPCKECMIEIINAGISEIVCVSDNLYDELSKHLLDTSGIKFRIYEHLK